MNIVLLSFFIVSLSPTCLSHQHRVPIIDVGGAESLVGTLREDRTIVNLMPRLKIKNETGPICSYELSGDSQQDIPFIAEVVDDKEGVGEIRLKDGLHLDCSTPQYKISVVAVRCSDNARSESIPLQITIKDVNDHAPEFPQAWYTFEVQEGKLYAEIARLEATDKDCGHPYGRICSYEITNALDAFPFAIDEQGVLRNTQPLNYTKTKSYILTVVAHDCGMRQSKSALVTVNVREACVNGLHGAPENINYEPQTKEAKILPDVHVKICAEASECSVKSVTSIITLHSSHLADGCDKDQSSLPLTLTRCDANADAISLLPTADENTLENNASGDKFEFDGKTNAYLVSPDKVARLIPETFTLLFAMKHKRGDNNEHNTKQNIMCESDDKGMNRHHFAIYTRHCKLEMLMRRESDAEAAFRAAEWRWSIPEICDGHWHTYAILFTAVDQVDLYIDGKKFAATSDNPEILDDWPLHKSKIKKTRLVVGACWHGRNQSMTQHFVGHLSYMLYVPGRVEQPQTLLCSNQCREQLRFNAIDQLVPGEEAIFENDSSVLTLKANTAEDLSLLLQKVFYVNSLKTPTPGHRSYEAITSVQCTNNKTMDLSTVKGYIFVKKQADPVLSISGVSVVNSDQHLVKTGAPMLADIKITVIQTVNDEEVEKTSDTYLDWCKVHLKPSRDIDLEYFSSPASLIASLHIDFEHDKQGILLKGKEKVKGYREILSKIHYFNTRADSFSKRIYGVQCAMDSGRILSNELIVTMNIEAPKPSESQLEEVIEPVDPQFDPVLGHFGGNRLQNILELDVPRSSAFISQQYEGSQGAVAGGAVAVVIVVCVGFLLVLLVIGVLKMREAPYPERHRNRKNTEGGMEWDDSGMNITVNPLDEVGKNAIGYTNEDESSDEADSFREDEMSEDEEEDDDEHILPHVQMNARPNATGLEWDDTTLTNVTRTYHV